MGKRDSQLAQSVCELKAMVKAQNKRIDALIKQMKDGCKTQEASKKGDDEQTWCPCQMNPFIECLNPDNLYHLSLDTKTTDFPKVFGDVRFVVTGGTENRMEKFANFIISEIGLKLNQAIKLRNISANGNRYALFKAGPVLCASHGIGGPSISILLHELIKLVYHAKCKDPVFFRLGTCGGIGIEPGTVVITSEVLDGQLRPYHEVVIQFVPQLRPAVPDKDLALELVRLTNSCQDGYDSILGKTLCVNDFYEGQSRLDGAFCGYKPEDKECFLRRLSCSGVVNIEMESSAFAALTYKAGIRAAIVTVILFDRNDGDQIRIPECKLQEWDERPQKLIARYMRKVLYGTVPNDDVSDQCDCECDPEPEPECCGA